MVTPGFERDEIRKLVQITDSIPDLLQQENSYLLHPQGPVEDVLRTMRMITLPLFFRGDDLRTMRRAQHQLLQWEGKPSTLTVNELQLLLKDIRRVAAHVLDAPVPSAESSFPKVKDAKLQEILDRDWAEARDLAESGAWKSCIVMCGSVLEALLYEYLLRDPHWTMDPHRCDIPSSKGRPKSIISKDLKDQWSLKELVVYACSNKVVTSTKAVTIHDTLREPRNLIHPMREVREQGKVDEETANVCLAMTAKLIKELSDQRDPPL